MYQAAGFFFLLKEDKEHAKPSQFRLLLLSLLSFFFCSSARQSGMFFFFFSVASTSSCKRESDVAFSCYWNYGWCFRWRFAVCVCVCWFFFFFWLLLCHSFCDRAHGPACWHSVTCCFAFFHHFIILKRTSHALTQTAFCVFVYSKANK